MIKHSTADGVSFLNEFLKTGSIVGASGNKFETLDGKYKFDPLMILYLQDQSGMKNALAQIYPPYEALLNRKSIGGHSLHEHTFGLLNLYSKKLLLIGLGRNCYPFVNDAESGEEYSWPSREDLSARAVLSNLVDSDKSFEKFFIGDHKNTARTFFDHVANIGAMVRSRENLGITPYDIEETAYKDGVEKEQALEDLGMDEHEFAEILNNYNAIELSIKESLEFINQYFPKIDESDINSDDFF